MKKEKEEKSDRKLHRDKKNPQAHEAWLERKKKRNAVKSEEGLRRAMVDTKQFAIDIAKIFEVPVEMLGRMSYL